MSTGPVEYMIVRFPGNRFTGEIAPALADLVQAGTIRVIDLAFVQKNADGATTFFELSDLDSTVAPAFATLARKTEPLLNEEDLQAAADVLEPNSSAALLVWEDVWATKVADAIRASGGELLDLERVPHEVAEKALEYAGVS